MTTHSLDEVISDVLLDLPRALCPADARSIRAVVAMMVTTRAKRVEMLAERRSALANADSGTLPDSFPAPSGAESLSVFARVSTGRPRLIMRPMLSGRFIAERNADHDR